MSDTRLLRFILELAQDPVRARQFRADPDSTMAGADLSPEQQDVLRSRDPSRIRAALVEGPVDHDLLMLAWLGPLAHETDAQS